MKRVGLIVNDKFILTNEQRKYLGLNPIEKYWEVLDIKGTSYYFDGNVIKKEISSSGCQEENFRYRECELDVETAENRTVVLPKTAKGKPKKLNFTATQSFRPVDVYFSYEGGWITIASYTTQKTFYSEEAGSEESGAVLENWLENWIRETTQADFAELETFKNEKRVHQSYKEGDIFAFKIGRRQYGFGKILIDIVKRRKTEEFKQNKNYGLANLMGTALVVKVYHKISDSMEVNLDELEQGLSLPPQAIMDNRIYYGEYKIIGNRAVTYRDLDDGPISTSKSINYQDRETAYLQYGFIYRELSLFEYKMYEDEGWYHTDYRDEGIGFSLNLDHLEECITAHSNEPYYGSDVRNGVRGRLSHPLNKKDKNAIFEAFGLDGNLDYEGNLKLHRASKE